MHRISQISLGACCIDHSSHQFLFLSISYLSNRETSKSNRRSNYWIRHNPEPLDLLQASLPDCPPPPPRFNPPNSESHVTPALAVRARLDPNRSIDWQTKTIAII